MLFCNYSINVTAALKELKPVAAKNDSFLGSAIVIVPLEDVLEKIEDGYRYVNFSEVDENEVMRGNVIQAVVEGNYYTDLVLGGGQLTSKSLCEDDSCNKKSTQFEFVANESIQMKLDSQPEYAVMAGPADQHIPNKPDSQHGYEVAAGPLDGRNHNYNAHFQCVRIRIKVVIILK